MPNDYDMPGEMSGNSPGQPEAPTAETPDAPMAVGGDKQTIMLSADMLGEMQPKNGQKITFCCTGDPDSEGNVPGYFEPAMGGEGGGEGGETWEQEFERSMSPRNEGEQ